MNDFPTIVLSELSFVDMEEVLAFSSGPEPWSLSVDHYFHHDAYADTRSGEVTSYVLRDSDTSRVMALGAIASGTVSWPKPNSKQKSVSVIVAYFGIAFDLRRTQTDGTRTSWACCDSFLNEAFRLWPEHELVCLSVDSENAAAIRFWQGYGFVEWGKPRIEDGRQYSRMVAAVSNIRARIAEHISRRAGHAE